MVLQVVTLTKLVAADLGTIDDLLVGGSGIIAVDSGNAVAALGGEHWVRIAGTVADSDLSGGNGVQFSAALPTDSLNRVLVTATGVISAAGEAINLLTARSTVTNYGLLDGTVGVRFGADVGSGSVLHNHGTINGEDYGVISILSEALTILNTGTIEGGTASVAGSSGDDTLRNLGHLYGAVTLGEGKDTYDGRGGTIEGAIYGGDGNDTFRLGAGIETVDGGAGIDTLDFRTGGAIHVALDGSFANTGAAADDDYSNIENIIGSRFGADSLAGDGGANLLQGLGGNDTLSGGTGNDTLTGGLGADKLTGGFGNDQFLFNAAGEGGDKITDFGATLRDNDSIAISAAGFGAGLVAGLLSAAQFQARSDNVAQDADDRFIFDTVHHQLWFDANGSGLGGQALLATLQAGAVLTASDILIF